MWFYPKLVKFAKWYLVKIVNIPDIIGKANRMILQMPEDL